MQLDETRPIPCDGVDTNVKHVGVGCAQGHVHVPKSIQTCGFDVTHTKAIETFNEAYCEMKAFSKTCIKRHLLVHRDLCEVQMLTWYGIWYLHMVEQLFGHWNCFWRVRSSSTILVGVPMLVKSSLMHCSFNVFFPC